MRQVDNEDQILRLVRLSDVIEDSIDIDELEHVVFQTLQQSDAHSIVYLAELHNAIIYFANRLGQQYICDDCDEDNE